MIAIQVLAAALLAAEPSPAAAPGGRVETASLVEGKLPEDPGKKIVLGKCQICHTVDYVTQQRLTPVQWQKTVEKMRKLGSPLTDGEVQVLSEYLAKHWTVDLPERAPKPVRAPENLLRFK